MGDKIKFTLTNGSYDNDNEQYKPEIFARVVKMSASAGDPEVQIKIISIIVNFFGSGFSTEKYKAIADKKVVVRIPMLSPDLSKPRNTE